MNTLFRFRQDLRLEDNTGLIHALHDTKVVYPIFIFDTTILDQFPKPDHRLHFLLDAVTTLDRQLREHGSQLHVFVGDTHQIILMLIKTYHINALYHNTSYGLGSQTRDKDIQISCQSYGVIYRSYPDFLLVEPQSIESKKVFTPFFNKRKTIPKKSVQQYGLGGSNKKLGILPNCFCSVGDIKVRLQTLGYVDDTYTKTIRFIDGRKDRFRKDVCNYHHSRNWLWNDGTTKLSPYIRFGVVSIRQVYEHFCKQHSPGSEAIVGELAWREFWYHIMYYFPETRMMSFQQKRRGIKRANDPILFEAWKEGRTGYPIIDAAMRQLKQEHRMHNRTRMIVASFLTKDLLIDWKWGEKHFADYLLDYDSNVNIGNRQWSASIGADPKPLRIFSPILQAQRFDPNAEYIKKYLPELVELPAEQLHNPLQYKLPYISPIVDHGIAQRRVREVYREG